MTKSFYGRVLMVSALALVVLVFGIPQHSASDAMAAPASNCTYFSNASYSTVVGQFGYDSCNNYIAWGRKTKYAVCGGPFPCVPPPR